jgi:hypothetical protein
LANPFLVLGGIAIGIITAGFGVLAVPGWVASAQDAGAQNDLSNAVAAQSASVSQTGKAATTLDALKSNNGLRFEESSGVRLQTYANGANWGVLAFSPSGAVFAKVSGYGDVFRGANLDALLAAPAFDRAWKAAGLPKITDAHAPLPAAWQHRYVGRLNDINAVPENTVVARNGTNFGMLTVQHVGTNFDTDTPEPLHGLGVTINGEVLFDRVQFDTPAQMRAYWDANASAAWAAAGFDPVDFGDTFAAWPDATSWDFTGEFDTSTSFGRAMFENIMATYLPVLTIPEEGADQLGARMSAAKTTGAGIGAMAVSVDGYALAVVRAEGGQTQIYTADSRDSLLADGAFQSAAAAAGVSF